MRTILLATALASGLAAGPSLAQTAIGDNTTITAKGTANSQVALAIGTLTTAHNVNGGLTFTGATTIGRNDNINTQGKINSQVAVAIGTLSTVSNNNGGILVSR